MSSCGASAVRSLEHGDGLQRFLLGQRELLTDPGHSIDGIIQFDFQQRLQLCNRVTELCEQLIQLLSEVIHLLLKPVIHGNTAADMDRVLGAHDHGTDLGGCHTGIRGQETDTGNHTIGGLDLTFCGKSLGIGSQKVFLLRRKCPTAAGESMICITVFELIPRKAGFHVLFQGVQQLIDGQHRIVLGVTGVGCGHFLVPDKQQCLRRMHG